MKKTVRLDSAWHLLLALLSLFLAATVLAGGAGGAATWSIENPYAGVDWAQAQQLKANFHTHTILSDGTTRPQEVIDRYAHLGYAALALTDHDTVGLNNDPRHPERHRTTWPWRDFGREPEKLGMVAIEGNEISRLHHLGSYFNPYGDPGVISEKAALEEIGRRGGLAVLFHPGRYSRSTAWYSRLYRAYPHLIGMEIYNQGDRYPKDRETWDAVLTEIAPQHLVWGFSNDDMHDPERHLGRNWNILLVEDRSEAQVRLAMEKGRFFFVYAPAGHGGPAPPVINSIKVDARAGDIEIEASGYESIVWIAEGRVVHRGERVNLSEVANPGGYIRAEIRGSGSLIGTQPFGIGPGLRLRVTGETGGDGSSGGGGSLIQDRFQLAR